MLSKLNQDQAKGKLKFTSHGWLKLNFYNFLLGLLIGVTISLLISAFYGDWLSLRSIVFNMLSSTIITLCITNGVYLIVRIVKFNTDNIWVFIVIYYVTSIVAMWIAIELVYLIRAYIYGLEYHFFHLQDAKFSGIIVVIVCTVMYLYNAQKERLNARIQEKSLDLLKLKQLKTQAELATLQSKINPHFLYNSLNSIASLIHEDPDKAESMTLKLSKLFRYSINNSQEATVEVQEEMEILRTYLDIEKVRFGDRIKFVIEVDDALSTFRIPRFLIQPLVENALKHGLKDVVDHALLRIAIEKKDGLVISVSDNGVPFPEDLEIGYGLQSTYDKLELLYPDQYEVQITNQPIKQIRIQIPLANG